MELNGLANIKIRISRLADKGAIPAEDALDLLRMADEFDKYLVAYHENPSVQWHEVKAKPEDFMTRSEQVEYFNKVWKMTDDELGQEPLVKNAETSMKGRMKADIVVAETKRRSLHR